MAGSSLASTSNSFHHIITNASNFVVTNTSAPSSITTLITTPPDTPSPYTHGLAGVNQMGNYFYINMLVMFFSILFLILLLARFTKSFIAYVTLIHAAGSSPLLAQNYTTIFPFIQRHLTLAPLFTHRHSHPILLRLRKTTLNFGTLPLRLPALILAFYLTLNIIFTFSLEPTTTRAATFAQLRGRSGALAAFNIIPTVLFALRNNPLIPLLRVSYDTFNLFHRWTARLVILLSLIHVGAWAAAVLVTSPQGRGLQELGLLVKEYASLAWGAGGMFAFLLLGGLAWSPVRRAAYETFLTGHRLLVLAALVGVYVHLDKGKLPQLPYVQLVFIFWAVEILARMYRILRWNVGVNKETGKLEITTSVLVEALQGEACRVTFTLARGWRWEPGCHVYVCFPSIEASFHPFSVAWADVEQGGIAEAGSQVLENPFADPDEDVEMNGLDKCGTTSHTTTVISSSSRLPSKTQHRLPQMTATKISLLIRPHSGFTKKLFALASATPQRLLATTGIVDGPYSSNCNVDQYGTVLLFAASVGITHQLGFVRHLVQGYASQTLCAKKVVLVWSIQTFESLAWIQPWLDEVLDIPRYRDVLQLRIFVTRGLLGKDGLKSSSGTLRMATGRCEPGKLVDEVFEARIGRMVVTVCGPGAFGDGVRQAVRLRVTDGGLDFIEEGFSY